MHGGAHIFDEAVKVLDDVLRIELGQDVNLVDALLLLLQQVCGDYAGTLEGFTSCLAAFTSARSS